MSQSKIKKAVIPAAGLGTRFLPATKAQPKEMLPIVDKPTIQYVVEEAVAAGITDILIITGRHKRAIEDHFDRSPELEWLLDQRGKDELNHHLIEISDMANIHFVRQKVPLGLGHAVLCARDHIGNEPFAVLLGDDVFEGPTPCLSQLMQVVSEYGGSAIAVERVADQDVSRYGIVSVAESREVSKMNESEAQSGSSPQLVHDLIEKPSLAEAPSRLAIVGRYILSPRIFDILATTPPGSGGEIQLTDALRVLARKESLWAYEFKGFRYDVGDKLGFVKATLAMALRRPEMREELMAYCQQLFFEYQDLQTEIATATDSNGR